jgi:flagellar hook assembly protein FlgD
VVAALTVATSAAIVVTQDLREQGTVISNVTVKGDGPAARSGAMAICFRLAREDELDVEIVGSEGRVRRLASDTRLEGESKHCYRWDGSDDGGSRAPPDKYRLRVILSDADRQAIAGEPIKLPEAGS